MGAGREEEEPLLDHNFENPSLQSSEFECGCCDYLGTSKVEEEEDLNEYYDDLGRSGSSACSSYEILQKRRSKVYQKIHESYTNLELRAAGIKEAKDQIIRYKPGAWIESGSRWKVSKYDVPKTITLMLVGLKGSGKSSLVNRILRVFEEDKFAPDAAQVSYNSLVGEGTYFLQEYMVPKGSSSFCLYDTRSLSENSSDNFENLKSWMTTGVRQGQLVIRDSDDSVVRENLIAKTRHEDYCSRKKRTVNFVIFVVNGLSVLQSFECKYNGRYIDLLAETYNCPYLSFKDDKPVIVITHGDLLSRSDRNCVRVLLGEFLGIPPDTQIFDIPDKSDPTTELVIVDMLRYSLEHAEKNLPFKSNSFEVLKEFVVIILFFLLTYGTILTFKKYSRLK